MVCQLGKTENKLKVYVMAGEMDKAKGAVKETWGKATGDKQTEAEGKADKVKGHVKDAAQDVKEHAEDAADSLKK
jgi:uncharacterized protein YjbJ (UPF0337 family)